MIRDKLDQCVKEFLINKVAATAGTKMMDATRLLEIAGALKKGKPTLPWPENIAYDFLTMYDAARAFDQKQILDAEQQVQHQRFELTSETPVTAAPEKLKLALQLVIAETALYDIANSSCSPEIVANTALIKIKESRRCTG